MSANEAEGGASGRISVKAVLVGLLVDIAGTTIGMLSLAVLLAVASGGSAAAIERAVTSNAASAAAVLIGLTFTAVGGYVAAAIAKRAELAHALTLGLVGTGFAALAALRAPLEGHAAPTWAYVLPLVLTIPASCLGGFLRARSRLTPVPTRDAASLSRCPFCHADVHAAEAALVCEGCLARHHEPCWKESGRCASCQGVSALARRRSRAPLSAGAKAVALALGVIALLAGAWALAPLVRSVPTAPAPSPSAEPVASVEVAAAPPASGVERVAPPAAEQTSEEPPPSEVDASLPALEGAADPEYREVVPASTPFGGAEPAPAWREVARIPPERTGEFAQPLWCGDASRFVVTLINASAVFITSGNGAEPGRVDLGGNVRHMAQSGNRLLLTLDGTPGVAVIDLDRRVLLPTRIDLPGPGACLAVVAGEPRRVYAGLTDAIKPGHTNAAARVFLVDAGRLTVVASTTIPSRSRIGNEVLTTDGRGRWVYYASFGRTAVLDPARAFRERSFVELGGDNLMLDRDAQLAFTANGVRRAGSLEPLLRSGGVLLGSLPDGSLLVSGVRSFERRHPVTAEPVGEPVPLEYQGANYAALLAGTTRVVRVRAGHDMALEVMDVPVDSPLRRPPALRLETLPPSVVYLGDEWTHTPRAADLPPGAGLRVAGPAGLSWDGTTARWRPTAEQAGEHEVTISASASGEERVAREPVTVRARTFTIDVGLQMEGYRPAPDNPHDVVVSVQPQLLPSGRLLVWCTTRFVCAIEVGTWRRRTTTLTGCTSVTEIGDTLWVAREGALVELSLPDLAPKSQVQGDPKSAIAALTPDAPLSARATFQDDRVLRPDGSTLRHHPDGRPHPAHDGTFYAALEPQSDGRTRVAFYGLPGGELLGTLDEPAPVAAILGQGKRDLLLASRAGAVILSVPSEYRRERVFVVIPYPALPE